MAMSSTTCASFNRLFFSTYSIPFHSIQSQRFFPFAHFSVEYIFMYVYVALLFHDSILNYWTWPSNYNYELASRNGQRIFGHRVTLPHHRFASHSNFFATENNVKNIRTGSSHPTKATSPTTINNLFVVFSVGERFKSIARTTCKRPTMWW